MNNFFSRGLSYSQLADEFKNLYTDIPHHPVLSTFEKRELKRFKYLIDNTHAYLDNHHDCSFDAEFEQLCLFYFDIIQIYIHAATNELELTQGISTTIIDTSLLLFSRIDHLSAELKRTLSYFASYLFENQNVFDLMRFGTELIHTLPEETYHSILRALYVDSSLGIESLYDVSAWSTLSQSHKMMVLDVKITSMLGIVMDMGDEYRFEKYEFKLIKDMCTAYLECVTHIDDFDVRFKLMAFLTLVEPLALDSEPELSVADLLYSVGTSIYGSQYQNIKNLGRVLDIEQDVSFWKNNFKSVNMAIEPTGLPDNVI